MAEVALTEIRYGSKGRVNPDGSITSEEAAKVIAVGDSIPSGAFSKEELQSLRDSDAVGEEGDAHPALGSTSATLQRPGSESLSNVPPQAADVAGPPSEEDLAKELDHATNQVARGTNAAKEAKAANK